MSTSKCDSINIDFDADWQCYSTQTTDNVNDLSFLTVTNDNHRWLSLTLPHIDNDVTKADHQISNSYNWWYRKQFDWIFSNQQTEQRVFLTFTSSNDQHKSNINAKIWINGTQIFQGLLLSHKIPIELTHHLLHSEETREKNKHSNILVVCCANTSLSLHALLIIHGIMICASGQLKLNQVNNLKQENILNYTVSVNDTDGRIGVIFNPKLKSKVPLTPSSTSVINERKAKENKEYLEDMSIPRLAIVILVVGTRGDVQPFIA
jgi:hypothetical protein